MAKNKLLTMNYIDSQSERILRANNYKSNENVIVNIKTDDVSEALNAEHEIFATLVNSPVFWSDRNCKYYMFDTKLSMGSWLENIFLNDGFDKIDCEIYFN